MAQPTDDARSLGPFTPVLALLAICLLINYVDRGNLSIAAPLLQDELGMSASQLGILLSAFFWSYTAMQFVSGWLVDRFDVNLVIAAGYLLWSLATATTGIVRGFTILLAMRLLLGIGESVAFPSCSKILARHLPEYHRGFANGVIASAFRCGNAVGTFGAGIVMARYGWRPVFIGIGLISLLWLPAWIRWMPRGREPAGSAAGTGGFADILRQRSFWGVCAGHFSGNYLLYFMLTFNAKHGEDCKHLLPGRCCIGDCDWPAFGCVDPEGLYTYSGTQNRDGNRIHHRMCRNGWFRGGPSNISAVAYGRWCRLRNGRFGYFRIHTDPRRSARGWTMGRPAKWFSELCRRGRPCSHGIRSGSDQQLCGSAGNHCSRANAWRPGVIFVVGRVEQVSWASKDENLTAKATGAA